jgi:predicted phosphodiesterase
VSEAEPRTDSVVLPRSKTRIVVLGDPHGDVLALSEVLARERQPNVAIFSAGDNVGYADGPSCSELCRLLEREGIGSVFGNHEAWSSSGKLFLSAPGAPNRLTDEALAWCRSLPYRIRIACEAAPEWTVSLVHTLPEWEYVNTLNASLLADQEGTRITFAGHSHAPAIYTIRDERVTVKHLHPRGEFPLRVPLEPGARYVVDAGSLARPASSGRQRRTFLERGTYAALDLEGSALRLYSFDKRRRLEELFRRTVEENTRRAREQAEP